MSFAEILFKSIGINSTSRKLPSAGRPSSTPTHLPSFVLSQRSYTVIFKEIATKKKFQ